MFQNQNSKIIAQGIIRACLTLAVIFLGVYILYMLKSLVIYGLFALILFMACHPIKAFFQNRLKLSNTLASIGSLSIFILSIGYLISLLLPFVTNQSENINQINFDALKTYLSNSLLDLEGILSKYKINIFKNLHANYLVENIEFSFLADYLNEFISIIQSFSIGLLSTIFISFFIIKDHVFFYTSGLKLIKNENLLLKVRHFIDQIKEKLTRYFFGVFIQTFLIFILYALTLYIAGAQNTFSIASISAMFNIIPYLGPLVGLILMLLFTAIEIIPLDFPSLITPMVSTILIGFSITQIIDNFFNQPMIFSRALKFHPLEIFIIIISFGLIFGLIGIILAIPVYTIIKVTLKEFFSTKKLHETKTIK